MRNIFVTAAFVLASASAGSAFASPVDGVERDLCGNFSVANAVVGASGQVCITAHIYNYGNGENRKVLVLPSNTAFEWTYQEGGGARITCTGVGGGGYLHAGTGTRLNCTVSVGNGSNRVSGPVQLR